MPKVTRLSSIIVLISFIARRSQLQYLTAMANEDDDHSANSGAMANVGNAPTINSAVDQQHGQLKDDHILEPLEDCNCDPCCHMICDNSFTLNSSKKD